MTAWATLMWVILLLFALFLALASRVTVCEVGSDWPSIIGWLCDFRAAGWIGLAVGAVLAGILVLFLAAHELSEQEKQPAALWKQVHRVPRHAYRALNRSGTPHRRKSIGALVLLGILLLVFYILVAFAHIAFF